MENKRIRCFSMPTEKHLAEHGPASDALVAGQLSPPTGLALWKSLKNRNKNKNSKLLSQVKLLSQNFRIGQICELAQPSSPAKLVANHRRSSPFIHRKCPKVDTTTDHRTTRRTRSTSVSIICGIRCTESRPRRASTSLCAWSVGSAERPDSARFRIQISDQMNFESNHKPHSS